MAKTIKFIGIILCILALCATTVFVVQKCSKPNIIRVETVVVDSVAVKTLKTEIAELTNKLNAKPKVITITTTVTETDTITITDTLLVYPVGSFAERRDYPFSFAAGKDNVEMKVNTDLYVYVYSDEHRTKMYHEDSLRVWITDFTLNRHIDPPLTKRNNKFYIMAGVNAKQYDQNIVGQTIKQTEVYPSIGAGYMAKWIGGYVEACESGFGLGVTIAPIDIFRKK